MQGASVKPAAHRFAKWLDGCGRARARVAVELDVGPSTVTLLAQGTRRPSLDLAVRIERLTGGAVRATDWSTP